MKEYKRRILWLDYFNSALTREQGRRIAQNKSVNNPTLEELVETARRLGYNPEPEVAKYPQRMMIPSGYISIEKRSNTTKARLISEFAKTLSLVRGEKSASVEREQYQKPQPPRRKHR